MKRLILSAYVAFGFLFICLFGNLSISSAQQTFPTNGARDTRPDCYAITNARIVISPTQTVEKATLVVRNGLIEAVGAGVTVPQDAVVLDAKGKSVYASFIDLDSDYGMPEAPPLVLQGRRFDGPQMESNTKGAYNWNQAIKPEKDASTVFVANPLKADELRKLGFGVVLSHQHDGIARGTSVLVSLADAKENSLVLSNRAAAQYSFDRGTSRQDYPNSLMGAIALLRQTYLDADWYKKSRAVQPLKTEYNASLEAWNAAQELPQIFEITNKLNVLRADKVGDETGVQYVFRGAGDEYQRIEDVRATKAAFILPLAYPAAYNVEDPLATLNIPLVALKHWEQAPTNPAALEKAGITFAFTTALLKVKAEFTANLQTALKYGLSKQVALAALTTVPAQIVKMSDKLGTLERGKIANFIVTSGDVFDKETIIFQNWVQGKPYELASPDIADIRGSYALTIEIIGEYTMTLKGTINAPLTELTQKGDSLKIPLTLDRAGSLGNSVVLRFARSTKATAEVRLSGWIDLKTSGETWSGKGQDEQGNWVGWSVRRTKAFTPEAPKPDTVNVLADLGARTVPFVEYGYKIPPKQETVLLKNATVWTNEKDGILKNTDVLLKNGKITAVGKGLPEAGAKVVDATGKHVTPGIMDEHSHIAISGGVNEASQSVTAEVRIGDVIDAEDVDIYRQLAGGVTSSHLLHGSANAIGGQTILTKLRWGVAPEAMKFEGADGFIKFALGENVKQANWGDLNTVRFPQTRMGVEQVMVDGFTRAKEYEAAWKMYNTLSGKDKSTALAPRRDLELDALVEIINKKRFITCHSYVQTEITMLMRVAEQFGFVVNTFTHILEGYKVADKMKAHGANASSFSDWWAYKMEVAEAIPYNGAILHAMGVTVAFNSDDAEMARRLNQEAAKAVKYGGVPEEEALKFVTLNPAKMMHVDNRVGSLKVGKDADVVVWSDNPLSIYAKAEKTFVDGILYFDREQQDKQLREDIRLERARLMAKMIKAKRGGAPVQAPPARRGDSHYSCGTVTDYSSELQYRTETGFNND